MIRFLCDLYLFPFLSCHQAWAVFSKKIQRPAQHLVDLETAVFSEI